MTTKVNTKHVQRFPDWSNFQGVMLEPDLNRECGCWSEEDGICNNRTTLAFYSGDPEQGLGVGVCSLVCLAKVTAPTPRSELSAVPISVISPIVDIFVPTELKQETNEEPLITPEDQSDVPSSTDNSDMLVLRPDPPALPPEPEPRASTVPEPPIELLVGTRTPELVPPSFSF